MMRSIVFDAGPVISLTTNNLLWVLDYLKESFEGDFYIPRAVKSELVDNPLKSKKFKFEALQVSHRINKAVLTVVDTPKIKALAEELLELANHLFKASGNWIKIVQYAEMEALAAAIVLNSSALVVDERITKMLVENPEDISGRLAKKTRYKITMNKQNLKKIQGWLKGVKILRSVELVMVAYEKGFLDKYLLKTDDARKTLVESLLWGIKLHGCAISRQEIDELVELEVSPQAGG